MVQSKNRPAGDGVDVAATCNQPRNSYWINIHSSGYGPTTNVSAITVEMNNPVGSPTLAIRSVALATNDPGDAVLEGKPLIDKRWWFVCPDGHLFYSTGLNGVGSGAGTRVLGHEDLFAALPPASLAQSGRGGRSFGGSFYSWNLQRRFGDDWRPKWAEFTTQRLAAWGFNTMHNWGVPRQSQAEPRVAYAAMLRGWQTGRSILGMPDVYAEDFARGVDESAASQLAPLQNDPYRLGQPPHGVDGTAFAGWGPALRMQLV